WKSLRLSMCVAGVYATILWLLSRQVMGLFTADPAVITLGGTLMLVAVFYEPARAVNIVGGFSLRTVGDSRFTLMVAMVFIWGILPVIIVVNQHWPLTLVGFWLFFAADEILRAIIIIWRWRTGR